MFLRALLLGGTSCSTSTTAGVMLVFETDGTLDPDTLHVSVTSGDGKSEGSDAGENGSLDAEAEDSTVPDLDASLPDGASPRATTTLFVSANLDSSTTVPTQGWDPQNPAATSNFSTSVTAFDSKGIARQIAVYFRHDASNVWEYYLLAFGSDIQDASTCNVQFGTGALTFAPDGGLQSLAESGGAITFIGAAKQIITLEFGTALGGRRHGVRRRCAVCRAQHRHRTMARRDRAIIGRRRRFGRARR